MLATNEPRNGDFVAYLEQLQRESAARLLSQSKAVQVHHTLATSEVVQPAGALASRTPLTRREAEELLARMATHRAAAMLIGPAVGVVFGAALLLYWFAAGSSLVTLLIGVALVIWSVRRLRRMALERTTPRATSQTLVSQVFGKPPGA